MSHQLTHELSIGYGLVALTQNLSAQGGWIQYGEELVDSNLPFGAQRMEQLTELVHDMATHYKEANRYMESLFFCFEEHFLAVVFEGNLKLGLLFDVEQDEASEITSAARKFLRGNQSRLFKNLGIEEAPAPLHWKRMEQPLRNIISSEFGEDRAMNIIAAGLIENPLPADVSADLAAEISRRIIKGASEGGQRRFLLSELDQVLQVGLRD